MIVLTAEIEIKGENPSPFIAGQSKLGNALFGETINAVQKIDNRNILSCETEIKDRENIDKPSFGIISSGGSLSFKDPQKRFLGYANMKILRGGERVRISLKNTVENKSELVGSYMVENWNYDNDNFSVSVSVSDGLEVLQNTDFYGYDTFISQHQPTNINVAFWQKFVSYLTKNFSLNQADYNRIGNIMQKIYSTTFYNDKASVWASQNKICQLLGLHTFVNKSGQIDVKTDLNWS